MDDIYDREIPELPAELHESTISAVDIVYRSELASAIGFAQGAMMPPRFIERLFNALEASDRLLVCVVIAKEEQGAL